MVMCVDSQCLAVDREVMSVVQPLTFCSSILYVLQRSVTIHVLAYICIPDQQGGRGAATCLCVHAGTGTLLSL